MSRQNTNGGNIPVKSDNRLITDSIEFSVKHAPDLPAGYTSSVGTDAPDLTYQLPYKNREATIEGYDFYVSTPFQSTFSQYHQLLIDRNSNDTLEIGSGSNEVYSSDLNQMRKEQKFFLYPSFELAGNSWQIANINPYGEWIRLRPSREIDERQKNCRRRACSRLAGNDRQRRRYKFRKVRRKLRASGFLGKLVRSVY